MPFSLLIGTSQMSPQGTTQKHIHFSIPHTYAESHACLLNESCWAVFVLFQAKKLSINTLSTYLWPSCHSLSLSPCLCPVDPCSECRDNVITMRHGAGNDSTAQRASVPIELQTRGQRGYSLLCKSKGEAELESHQGAVGERPWMHATWAGSYGWPHQCDTKAMALGRESYRLYVFGGVHLCGCQQGLLNKRWLKR